MPTSMIRNQFKTAISRATALFALLSATSCFSQPLNYAANTEPSPGASGQAPAAGSSRAQLGKPSWTLAGTTWSGGRSEAVNDPGLDERAFTITVPASWKFKGLILRPGGCYGPTVPADGLSYTELAPDGYTA